MGFAKEQGLPCRGEGLFNGDLDKSDVLPTATHHPFLLWLQHHWRAVGTCGLMSKLPRT